MRTEDLVRALAMDARPTSPLRRTLLSTAVASGSITLLAYLSLADVRPDLAAALRDPRVLFKFVFSAAVVVAAGIYCLRAIRPDGRARSLPLLGPVLALLLVGVGAEAIGTPRSEWRAAAHGRCHAYDRIV